MAEFSAKMRELSDMISKFVATLESKDGPKLHELQTYLNDNIALSPTTDSGTREEIVQKIHELFSSAEDELNSERRRDEWINILIKIADICVFLLDDSKWG